MQQFFQEGRSLYIGIDFDGTVVTHEYPETGEDVGAVPVLLELVDKGHKLLLNTMRSGEELAEAVRWFKEHNIPLEGINKNPNQESWTSSPKVYAQIYIDDAALGCPLKFNKFNTRPYVDWGKVWDMLKQRNVI